MVINDDEELVIDTPRNWSAAVGIEHLEAGIKWFFINLIDLGGWRREERRWKILHLLEWSVAVSW
jgi:hypothetical protein